MFPVDILGRAVEHLVYPPTHNLSRRAKLGGNALFAYADARSSRAQVFEANVLRTNRL